MKARTQIRRQIQKLEQQAEKLRRQSMAGVIKRIRALMAKHGVTIEDLGSAGPGKRRGRKPGRPAKRKPRRPAKPAKKRAPVKRKPVASKYRSPKDKNLTWSGRGRAPLWAREWVAKGKNLNALLIKK